MQIDRTDVMWNYGATFLKIASSVLLFPLILRLMPTETVGIWSIFMTIATLASLLDFGFSPSFTRNVTYVFSGVTKLRVQGVDLTNSDKSEIDYGLLKSVIMSMKWIYLRVTIILLILLITIGTYYINFLLKNYTGDKVEVYISWGLLSLSTAYNLYTMYYDSLLLGRGLIKKSKQIIIIGQIGFLVVSASLILAGKGLIAIILGLFVSTIIVRILSYKAFFTKEIREKLNNAIAQPIDNTLKAITPNAIKIGITSLGGFMVQKSAIIIGSIYLSLEDIASYGITLQVITVISSLAAIHISTYQPKIVEFRVRNNNEGIKELFLKGQIIIIITYLFFGTLLLFMGDYFLKLINSDTSFLPFYFLLLALFISFEQTNIIVAGLIILTKNEVPFFKAGIISGISIVLGLVFAFSFADLGILTLLVVPLVVDLSYQAWKWPTMVYKELGITFIYILTFLKLKRNDQITK